jgi:hypothetical protein
MTETLLDKLVKDTAAESLVKSGELASEKLGETAAEDARLAKEAAYAAQLN